MTQFLFFATASISGFILGFITRGLLILEKDKPKDFDGGYSTSANSPIFDRPPADYINKENEK